MKESKPKLGRLIITRGNSLSFLPNEFFFSFSLLLNEFFFSFSLLLNEFFFSFSLLLNEFFFPSMSPSLHNFIVNIYPSHFYVFKLYIRTSFQSWSSHSHSLSFFFLVKIVSIVMSFSLSSPIFSLSLSHTLSFVLSVSLCVRVILWTHCNSAGKSDELERVNLPCLPCIRVFVRSHTIVVTIFSTVFFVSF